MKTNGRRELGETDKKLRCSSDSPVALTEKNEMRNFFSHWSLFEFFKLFYFQISAQESRRKKKEYVDALEKRIAECLDENKSLKERVNKMEKSQK